MSASSDDGRWRRSDSGRVPLASGSPSFDPALEIRRVQWAAFSSAEQQAVLDGSAARLLGTLEDAPQ